MKRLIPAAIPLIILFISCENDTLEHKPANPADTLSSNPAEPPKVAVDTLYAVCVVADFPNSKLEDMNSGMNSVDKVWEVLNSISHHWVNMSQDRQALKWKQIRVTVSEDLSMKSFNNSWYDYRQDVLKQALLQLETSEYDIDNDNSIDVMFIIASNNNLEPDYLIGGAAEVFVNSIGAQTFVDQQSGLSLEVRATGNFSHEIGHNLGLPDIYGPKDNVQYLTIMSDSWAIPPHIFSAYEKDKLGWAEPQLIIETTPDIELKPGERSLDFLKIPTVDTLEYFLVEYRKRQPDSYTSEAVIDYDGIVIYNVKNYIENGEVLLELLSVVPADGKDYFNSLLQQTAFWYPANAFMPEYCSLKTSDGKACGILLTDFKFTDSSMSVNVVYE